MLDNPIKQENKMIRTPQVIDLTSSCSGGECPKRDECIHYQIYLKLEDKSRKNYGSATCLSFNSTFNSFNTTEIVIYHRFKPI